MHTHNTLPHSRLPRPKALRRIFKKLLFGTSGRPCCPECRSKNILTLKSEERWRCRNCRYTFSIKSCSWLKGSKLSLEAIWILLHCWQKQYPRTLAHDQTGVSLVTIARWYEQFRLHLPLDTSFDEYLEHEVVADEMFVKGACVLGAKQKGGRKLSLRVLRQSHPNKSDAVDFLEGRVLRKSTLFTDGGSIYKGIKSTLNLHDHRTDIHKKFEFTLTAEIEGVWGNLRTFFRRMYHHVRVEKLPSYVREFEFRFCKHKTMESPLNYFEVCLIHSPSA